jgi:muconolactone delta-isomerase
MASKRKKAAAIEVRRAKEAENTRELQRQEMGILIDKIQGQWSAHQLRASKEWEEKEAQILTGFSKIENVFCELKAVIAERATLERQLKTLTEESDHLKQIPSTDSARQDRLVRINNLRLEIRQLEEDVTTADAELRAVSESKNRYKRLFLESNKVLQSMLEEEKQRRKGCRKCQ